MEPIKIAVFASGTGTNAQNIFRFAKGKGLSVVRVICDRPGAKVIGRARVFQIPVDIVPFEGDRDLHEEKIISLVEGVDWIFLAGYMRILGPNFIKAFYDKDLGHSRIVNIHPSLLPKYPGLNSYQRAYQAGDEEYGSTLHFVDEGVDSGKIIEQVRLIRGDNDCLDEFIERGMRSEYQLYRNFMESLLRGDLR